MRKVGIIIGAILLMALFGAVYFVADGAPSAEAGKNEQMAAIIVDGGCLDCHTASPELPFYASFPVAGDLVKKDAADGYRAFDIEPMYEAVKSGAKVSEVDLAKVEKVIADGTMPPAKYFMAHWGAYINAKEKAIALDWIKECRAKFYPNKLAAAEFVNETVRPVEDAVKVNPEKVALGEMLYHDTRLSVDNTVSCASCHGLNTGGVDNKQYSEGVNGLKGGVNAPTVFNAHYNFVQFWDGRAATLAAQAAGPPLNPVEMASTSFDEICGKLKADADFDKAFTAVYPEGITEQTITDAIQEFERTLLTPNSAFDKYLKGNKAALNAEEVAGYELFKKYDCATCHVGENLGGQSYELMGLTADYFGDRGTELTTEDNGRNKETKLPRDKHRFKVPGLRNVALTAPYFHDGTQATLAEAVAAMAKYEVGVEPGEDEVAKIVAFLKSLTGEYKGKTLTNDNMK